MGRLVYTFVVLLLCMHATKLDFIEKMPSNKYFFQETQDPDCTALPSIVVCPPSLIGHWAYEVTKFIDKEYLDPLAYAGTPTDRIR